MDLVNDYIEKGYEAGRAKELDKLMQTLDPVGATKKNWRGRSVVLRKVVVTFNILLEKFKEFVGYGSEKKCLAAINALELAKETNSLSLMVETETATLEENIEQRKGMRDRLHRMKVIVNIIQTKKKDDKKIQKLSEGISKLIDVNEKALQANEKSVEKINVKHIQQPPLTQKQISDLNKLLLKHKDDSAGQKTISNLKSLILSSKNMSDVHKNLEAAYNTILDKSLGGESLRSLRTDIDNFKKLHPLPESFNPKINVTSSPEPISSQEPISSEKTRSENVSDTVISAPNKERVDTLKNDNEHMIRISSKKEKLEERAIRRLNSLLYPSSFAFELPKEGQTVIEFLRENISRIEGTKNTDELAKLKKEIGTLDSM